MICFKDIDFVAEVELVIMFRIAESDHSHAGQKAPLGLSNPKFYSKQVQLKQVIQGMSGCVSNISKDRDLQDLFQHLTILKVQFFPFVSSRSFPCSF